MPFIILFLIMVVLLYNVKRLLGVATYTDIALPVLERFEGFSSKPYKDYKQWSIGYGSYCGPLTGPPQLSYISKADALSRLKKQMPEYFQTYVGKYLRKPVSEKQKAALTSFAYNYPKGATKVAGMINAGTSKTEIGKYWLSIVYAGGKVNEHLVERRKKEWALFNA